MKKILTIIAAAGLFFSLSGIVAAANKTIFTDYSKEEGYDNYGPKIGFDWVINDKWGFAANYQFKGSGDREATAYTEVRYTFPKPDVNLIFSYENSESLYDGGIKFSTFRSLKEALWFDGWISYTAYTTQGDDANNPDYQLLKLFVGLQHQLNAKMLALVNSEWTDANYDENILIPSENPNYIEGRLSAGLVYQVTEIWRIGGTYSLIYTKCDDPGVDAIWGGSVDRFVVTTQYNYKRYTFYLEYPFPQKGNIAKIGVSYSF